MRVRVTKKNCPVQLVLQMQSSKLFWLCPASSKSNSWISLRLLLLLPAITVCRSGAEPICRWACKFASVIDREPLNRWHGRHVVRSPESHPGSSDRLLHAAPFAQWTNVNMGSLGNHLATGGSKVCGNVPVSLSSWLLVEWNATTVIGGVMEDGSIL